MKAFYDLHIHSVLSPCAERDMTPNNIVNMALIKELNFIAITDHNSIANVAAALKVAADLPITVIPGIEVQSKEDVHAICLFKEFAQLECFYDHIIAHITPMDHDAKRFGEQTIMDENDQIVGNIGQSVYASIQLSVDDIVTIAAQYGGHVIPAHLDRPSYSMIANLGFIAPDLAIKAIEISGEADVTGFIAKHRYLKNYRLVINSDAHELYRISEPQNSIEVAQMTIDAFFDALFGG